MALKIKVKYFYKNLETGLTCEAQLISIWRQARLLLSRLALE